MESSTDVSEAAIVSAVSKDALGKAVLKGVGELASSALLLSTKTGMDREMMVVVLAMVFVEDADRSDGIGITDTVLIDSSVVTSDSVVGEVVEFKSSTGVTAENPAADAVSRDVLERGVLKSVSELASSAQLLFTKTVGFREGTADEVIDGFSAEETEELVERVSDVF